MIIERLKEFFSACPLINGANVNVDFLDKIPLSLSINPEPCEPIIRKYTCGGFMKQFCFSLAVRVGYGSGYDTKLPELLEEWINQKNSEPPQLDGGRVAQRLEITKSAHMFEEDIHTAGISIGCRLIYTED